MFIKSKTNSNPDVEYRRTRDAFFNNVEDYQIGFLVPQIKERMKIKMQQGYWKGISLGSPKVFKAKPLEEKCDVCIVSTLISGNLVQLRKSIFLINAYLKNHEPNLKFQIHVYIRKKRSIFPAFNSSSEALHSLFPIISQLHFEKPLTSPEIIFDKATKNCDGSRFIIFLEDNWETVYFSSTFHDDFLYSAPVFQQAIDLMEAEKDVLEVWLGDTPRSPHYSERSGWKTVPGYQIGSDSTYVKYYRKQYANNQSALGITRPGGSLKMLSRIKSLPAWTSLWKPLKR